MSGQKGRSGGKRPGAGAPVRTVTLRIGDKFAVHQRTDAGPTLGALGVVTKLTRNQIEVTCDDGVTLVMLK